VPHSPATATPHRAPAPHPARPARGTRRRPALPADTGPALVLGLIAAGAAGALAVWWAGTPDIRGAGQWLTDAGRVCGLLAGYGAPVLLLLMARIPALENGIGSDRLARWHAHGGRYLVWLVLTHIAFVVWGYALTDHSGVLGEGTDIVLHYPDMLKATAGTLLLFATGVLSARAARRRLRYEAWYYLHLATYLAVALAFAHQLSNGADLIASGAARAYWYTLYFGTAVVVGWFRLLRPFLRDQRHQLRVAEVRPEAPGVVSVLLTGRRLDELGARPGQFFRLQFEAPGLRWSANPYSLSAPADPRFLRFTVKDLGDHSAAAARLRPGTHVHVEGPYGAFTARRRRRRQVLLIAAGVGITPLRALFESLPARRGDLTLVYRVSREQDVLFRAELESIARARGARLHLLVGRRAEIGDPLRAEALARLVPGLARHDVFVCGPEALAARTELSLRAAGVPARHIHRESFAF